MPAKAAALASQRSAQLEQRRQQRPHAPQRHGHVHRGREDIVRRLAEVDVVVRDARAWPAAASARDARLRDDLVDVHVALRARAGLPHRQRELGIELAGRHARRRGCDRLGLGRVEQAQLAVDLGGGALDLGQRMDQRAAACAARRWRRSAGCARSARPTAHRPAPRWRRSCRSRVAWMNVMCRASYSASKGVMRAPPNGVCRRRNACGNGCGAARIARSRAAAGPRTDAELQAARAGRHRFRGRYARPGMTTASKSNRAARALRLEFVS